MPRILFLTTSHRDDDDRIFHHQAKELMTQGYEVKISSLSSDNMSKRDGILFESENILSQSVKNKKTFFQKVISAYKPDCIIASEPLAVIAARGYISKNHCRILYDITEWYPSDRMLAGYSSFLRPVHYIKFSLIQMYAGLLSHGFIFGEKSKFYPLAYFFPWKKRILLPYFPDKKFIHESVKVLNPKRVTLCYTGTFSRDKGIDNFFNAVNALREMRPKLIISLLLMGSARLEDHDFFKKLTDQTVADELKILQPAPLEKFTENIADADICFDLRPATKENHRCLPIKIFYYAAAGKPVIYTHLKAVGEHLDVSKFGFTTDPQNPQEIARCICKYLDDPELYKKHAQNAVSYYKKELNWNKISGLFVNFVKQFSGQ